MYPKIVIPYLNMYVHLVQYNQNTFPTDIHVQNQTDNASELFKVNQRIWNSNSGHGHFKSGKQHRNGYEIRFKLKQPHNIAA